MRISYDDFITVCKANGIDSDTAQSLWLDLQAIGKLNQLLDEPLPTLFKV